MIVVTAFHPGDADQALRFAAWLKDLGGAKGHELILVRDTRCDLEQSEWLRALFAESFDNVEQLDFVDHFQKWPDAPNAVFGMVARHIQRTKPQPWLFCEPDCVLLKAGAFDLIAAEYQEALAAGKVFLGDFVSVHTPELDVPDHMSGNAVYPGDMMKYAGVALIAGDLAWDVAAAAQILPQMHKSRLVHHSWKHGAFADWDQFEREVLAFKPEATIFHADKSGSLYPLLRARMNLPVSRMMDLDASKTADDGPKADSGHADENASHRAAGSGVLASQETGGNSIVCDIFIKTYPPDYPWLAYCLRSIRRFASGVRQIVVVTPDVLIPDWLKEQLPPTVFAHENSQLHLRVDSRFEYGLGNPQPDGYLSQQVFKLYADTLTDADLILFTDSDTIFTRHVTPQSYLTDGKVDWMMTPWAQTETPWQPIVEKFLGRPVEFEFMRRMPFMVPRWLLQSIREFCEKQHGMPLDQYVMSQPYRAFSEFNALGAFAYYFHNSAFNWINTANVPADQWPPLTVLQGYSHGGLKPDIVEEFEKILSESNEIAPGATILPEHDVHECRWINCPQHSVPANLSASHGNGASLVATLPQQTPWENKAASLEEIRGLAESLKKFCGRPPEVRAVRQALHNAGVIQLAYRFKRRKGWRKRK